MSKYVTKEQFVKLIDVILNSDTECDNSIKSHYHGTFDEHDRHLLEELKDEVEKDDE